MEYIDSHCHLHDSRIVHNIMPVMARARKTGVLYMVSCATMEQNFELTAQLSRNYPVILPCFGIHPWFVGALSENWKQALENYLTKMPSCVGETGLDFTDKKADQDLQLKVFEYHLALARELNLPVTIHVRKAWNSFVEVLKKFGKFKTPGIVHSYSGSCDMIPMLEKTGLYISFSGSVTNPGAKKVVSALKKVSQNRFVLETDTPDIYPYIGQSDPALSRANRVQLLNRFNEPANVAVIAKIASERINVQLETFCENALKNSNRVFLSILKKREKE